MKRSCTNLFTAIPVVLSFLAGCGLLNTEDPGNLVPPTVTEDPSLPSGEVNGTLLHLETFGDPGDTPVIFLHGGPGGDYRAMTRLCGLADQYYLVLFDQRGTGLSQRLDWDDISCALYIDDLDRIVDIYGSGRPVVLLGHSWGCQYAAMYTSRHPDKVAKLIMIDPGPLTGEDYSVYFLPKFVLDLTAPWISDWEWSQEFLSPDTHARMDYMMLLGALHVSPEYHKSTTDPAPLWRVGAVANAAIMGEGSAGSKPQWDFTVGLEGLTGDVLFIRGGLNEVHTEHYMIHVMQSYFGHANTTFVTIPDAGHDQIWVKAGETMAAIRSFL
jgi:proline iminopeptidase